MRAYARPSRKLFAEWGQIAQVLKVVIADGDLRRGGAVARHLSRLGVLLIAGFMRWIGRYGWLLTLVVSLGLPIITYVTFEKWFLVPLPKGPIEDLLGL